MKYFVTVGITMDGISDNIYIYILKSSRVLMQ